MSCLAFIIIYVHRRYNQTYFIVQVQENEDGTQKVVSSREATPARLKNQIDDAIGGHRISSAMINGGNGMSTRGKLFMSC